MATVTFSSVSNDGCTLSVVLDGVQRSPIIVYGIGFPFTFDPTHYGQSPDDINGTYTFDCNGCEYIRVIDYHHNDHEGV